MPEQPGCWEEGWEIVGQRQKGFLNMEASLKNSLAFQSVCVKIIVWHASSCKRAAWECRLPLRPCPWFLLQARLSCAEVRVWVWALVATLKNFCFRVAYEKLYSCTSSTFPFRCVYVHGGMEEGWRGIKPGTFLPSSSVQIGVSPCGGFLAQFTFPTGCLRNPKAQMSFSLLKLGSCSCTSRRICLWLCENQEVWKTDRATQMFVYVCLFSVANNPMCSAAPHCSKEEHTMRGTPSMYGTCIDQIMLLPGLCHKGKSLCSCKYQCYSAHGQHGS